MQGPRSPYREVVDEENTDILGTLTSKMWATFQEADALAEFYDLQPIRQSLRDLGVRMSGAVGGEHRRDLVQAIQGAKPATMALGVPMQPQNGNAEVTMRERRPGL